MALTDNRAHERERAAAHDQFPQPGLDTAGDWTAGRHPKHDMRALALREYGSEVLALTSEQAGALNRVGGGKYLSVEPEELAAHWRVTAHNYVGSINAGGLQVLVRPKIPLRNLFLLLEVGLRDRDWHDEAVRYETTLDLLPALVSFFARTTETTLARGLYHSYREQRDRLVAMRGRVDIARQLDQPGVVIPMHCKFTEFTADLIENSYLKAAVSRSLRVAGVQPIDRRRLMQHLVTLEDVGDARHHHTDSDRVVFTRLNEHYRPALRLAQLVLANLTLQDAVGATQASSFHVGHERSIRAVRNRAAATGAARTPGSEGPAPRQVGRRSPSGDPGPTCCSARKARPSSLQISSTSSPITPPAGAPPTTTNCWPIQPLWICLKVCSSTASTPTSLTTTVPSPDCLGAMPPKGPLRQAPRLPHRFEFATPARCCTPTRWTCLAPPTTWTRRCASLPTGLPNARPRRSS